MLEDGLNTYGGNPEKDLANLCRLIERLSPKARKIWNTAKVRNFDFGMDGVDQIDAARLSISPKSVQRIAALKGTLTVTVYRPVAGFYGNTSASPSKAQRCPGKPAPRKPKP